MSITCFLICALWLDSTFRGVIPWLSGNTQFKLLQCYDSTNTFSWRSKYLMCVEYKKWDSVLMTVLHGFYKCFKMPIPSILLMRMRSSLWMRIQAVEKTSCTTWQNNRLMTTGFSAFSVGVNTYRRIYHLTMSRSHISLYFVKWRKASTVTVCTYICLHCPQRTFEHHDRYPCTCLFWSSGIQ